MTTAYRVELTKRAARDLQMLFLAVRAAESTAAARWFNGLEVAIDSLNHSPHRCPAAPESAPRRVIRQLLYGRKPHIYRVLYSIKEQRRLVFILHIRHGARRPASGVRRDI